MFSTYFRDKFHVNHIFLILFGEILKQTSKIIPEYDVLLTRYPFHIQPIFFMFSED